VARSRAACGPLAERAARVHHRSIVRSFLPVLGRDLAIAGGAVGLGAWDAALRATGALPWVVGGACGVLVTVTAFLAHEWGHWIGAVASGGRVARPRGTSAFLFHYDTGRSTRAQFLWMSAGGYVASAIGLAIIAAWADLATASGVVALALSGLGVAVTLVLEVPTTVRVARGGPLPTGGVYID
jgi:hypothetical protein